LEKDSYGEQRELRYATAARSLLKSGATKKATADLLVISTSVLDRLVREWPTDTKIEESDHLRALIRE
jgi:hypothetical protein